MMSLLEVKKKELGVKRLELQIDEFEVRKLDLQVELDSMDNKISAVKADIITKQQEIEELKNKDGGN